MFLTGDRHSITEIAQLTGLPISTTHRMAADLAAWQLLHRAPDGLYRIGSTVQQLGSDATAVPALMDAPPDRHGPVCGHRDARAVRVLARGRVTYIEKRPGPEPITSFAACATRPPHASAAGKAILAFAPSSTVAGVAQNLTVFTPQTLDTLDRLRRALGIVRLARTALACGERRRAERPGRTCLRPRGHRDRSAGGRASRPACRSRGRQGRAGRRGPRSVTPAHRRLGRLRSPAAPAGSGSSRGPATSPVAGGATSYRRAGSNRGLTVRWAAPRVRSHAARLAAGRKA